MKNLNTLMVILILLASNYSIAQWNQKGESMLGFSNNAQAGFSVDISSDGNTVIYGAPDGTTETENLGGLTTIMRWDGSTWNQIHQSAGYLQLSDHGHSVAISGDGNRYVIGDPYYGEDFEPELGRVRIGSLDGTPSTVVYGDHPFDDLGGRVAMSTDGSTVALGAPRASEGMLLSGYVLVYRLNGSEWEPLGNGFYGPQENYQLGSSVSLSADGNTIAIGASQNFLQDGGYVRVYSWNGNAWQGKGEIIYGETPYGHFGGAVSLNDSGDLLAVGDIGNDDNGENAGQTKIFEWNGSAWDEIGSIDGESAGERAGASVQLNESGKTIVIGASVANSGRGITRIFDYDGSSWIQKEEGIDGEESGEFSGSAVAISADGLTVVVGEPGADSNGFPSSGKTRVFNCPPPVDPCEGFVVSYEQEGIVFANTTQVAQTDDPCCPFGIANVTWTVHEEFEFGDGPNYVTTSYFHDYNYFYSPSPGAVMYQVCLTVENCLGCSDSVCGPWQPSLGGVIVIEDDTKSAETEPENQEMGFTISPNPADDYVKVVLNKSGLESKGEIRVLDSRGSEVNVSVEQNKNGFTIDAGKLSPGMYIVTYSSVNDVVSKRLVIK